MKGKLFNAYDGPGGRIVFESISESEPRVCESGIVFVDGPWVLRRMIVETTAQHREKTRTCKLVVPLSAELLAEDNGKAAMIFLGDFKLLCTKLLEEGAK